MTRKLDMSRYGGMSGTKLTVDDLEADQTVATIMEFGEEKNPDGFTPVLRLREVPEKKLYINRTQLEYIVKKLGDDTDSWVGKRIPLEKKIVPFENDRFPKVYVMPPEKWDEAIRQWDREHGPQVVHRTAPEAETAGGTKRGGRR